MKKIIVPNCLHCPHFCRYRHNACHRPVTDINAIPADCPLPNDPDLKQILSDFLGVWQGKTGELNKHGEAIIDAFISNLNNPTPCDTTPTE